MKTEYEFYIFLVLLLVSFLLHRSAGYLVLGLGGLYIILKTILEENGKRKKKLYNGL